MLFVIASNVAPTAELNLIFDAFDSVACVLQQQMADGHRRNVRSINVSWRIVRKRNWEIFSAGDKSASLQMADYSRCSV